ncbi:MAG: NUDIX hydrolase [Eubacterium sp.]
MEILDIVDENGVPTGEVVDRTKAHTLGIPHRTAHVWIVREKNEGLQLLLQKRSDEKDSYPGCFDISSAGHIPAGVDYIPSALRELKEELGQDAEPEQLIYCGQRRFEFKQTFHGKPFCDNQVSNIYLLWLDKEPEEFVLQKEEVSEVRWFDFEECIQKVQQNSIPHCIYMEELEIIKQQLLKMQKNGIGKS